MAHDGLARAIQPVHTPWDGDTVFALSTGRVPASELVVGALAAEVTARAIVRAVRLARGLPGLPSASEIGA
jgi:L-aminopeptidase/D-esterase-like protein